MILSRISLKNFGCFQDFELSDLNRLSVVIGENDAGKTVLLNAIEVLLTDDAFDPDRHPRRTVEGSVAEEVTVEGEFALEPHDDVPEKFRSGPEKNTLLVRKQLSGGEVQTFVKGRGYSDKRLDEFETFNRPKQREILKDYGVSPEGRTEDRLARREKIVEQGKAEHEWKIIPTTFSRLEEHLPGLEKTSATNYRSPNRMVRSTLKKVAATVVAPEDEDGKPKERGDLQPIRDDIEERLNEEIRKAKDELLRQHSRIQSVGVEPEIDFTSVVEDVSLTVDLGDGKKRIESFGEGTKKRIWMGLLEWDREATSESARESVIRLYDEPDLNLHYEAQRRLFENVSALAEDRKAKTQCFVCTHSVFFIDRASPESINLIEINDQNRRSATYIEGPDVETADGKTHTAVEFFDRVGRAVGLSNTSLLYEKGFFVVEGPSEDEALPILYNKLFDESLSREGIQIVNLRTCGAWKSVLGVLLENRLEMVHLLLDTDCTNSESSLTLTREALEEDNQVDCPDGLFENQTTFIGAQEFEDAFSDEVYVRALNENFPRENGEWEAAHIQRLRDDDKFSSALQDQIFDEVRPQLRNEVRKPQIARSVAQHCYEGEIPEAIVEAFTSLRERAGID